MNVSQKTKKADLIRLLCGLFNVINVKDKSIWDDIINDEFKQSLNETIDNKLESMPHEIINYYTNVI